MRKYKEVEIWNEKVKLDKMIKVYLTHEDMTLDELNMAKITYKDLQVALHSNEEFIITTQLEAVKADNMLKGYEIMIISQGKSILLSESFEQRAMRDTQNWYKMLLSGVFPIEVEFKK